MEKLGITVFDVAVIAVAVFGAAIGMSSGFAHAVLFIGSWIGAGWVALNYSQLVEPASVTGVKKLKPLGTAVSGRLLPREKEPEALVPRRVSTWSA